MGTEDNKGRDSGGNGGRRSGARKLRDVLSGAPKSNASGAAPKARKINPRTLWSPEQRAVASAAAKSRWAALRAAATGTTAASAEPTGEDTSGLEVKPPVEPIAAPKPASKETVAQLCELLFVGHMMGSQFLKVEELKLSKMEADSLGVAIANVGRHYQWGAMAEKTKDWLLLGGCACMVYGPKVEHLRARRAAAIKAKMTANPTGGIKMPDRPPDAPQPIDNESEPEPEIVEAA